MCCINGSMPFTMDISLIQVTTENATVTNTTVPSPLELLIEEIITKSGVVLGILSIILNAIFLLLVHYLKEKSSAYHRFMKNLSFADIMASFSFLLITNWPKGFFGHIHGARGFILMEVLPYAFRSLPWLFFTVYLLTLSILTVNQYIAVCKPWRYSELITPRMVTMSMILIWSLSSLQILIPMAILMILYGISDKHAAMRALYAISRIEIQIWMSIFAVSVIINIIIDVIIYKKIRQLKLKRRYNPISNNPESLNIRMKHEAFVTVSLLVVASIFCRLPFPLTGIISINVQARILNAGIVMLLYLNFFVDPIIYVLRMRDLRQTFKRMLTSWRACCCGKSNYFNRSLSMRMLSMRTETTVHTVVNIEMNNRKDSNGANPVSL